MLPLRHFPKPWNLSLKPLIQPILRSSKPFPRPTCRTCLRSLPPARSSTSTSLRFKAVKKVKAHKPDRVRRVIHSWQDGFTVDDGPFYSLDDPAIAELERGQGKMYDEILNIKPGQEVDVEINDTNGSVPYGSKNPLHNSTPNKTGESSKISLRPLFVGLGICFGAWFIAEVAARRADRKLAKSVEKVATPGMSVRDAKSIVSLAEKQKTLAWLQKMQAPGLVGELYVWYKDWWLKKSDGEKATLILMAMNAVPFLLWKAPNAHIRIFMTKNFLDYPGRSPGYTLLTSVFSHKDFMHIAFNMVGLYSFGPPAFNYFQQSQLARFTSNPNNESLKPPHTTNLYSNISLFLTFGVLANLLPHYASQLAIRSPLLMRSSAAQALIPRPGLGASGAVYSMLVVSAMAYPKMAVSLIFLPMVPISIGYAVPGMCLVDAVGILRGWHSFGHLTHLTGAGVGYLSVQRNRWKNSQVGIAR